jgi:hypothetical protein
VIGDSNEPFLSSMVTVSFIHFIKNLRKTWISSVRWEKPLKEKFKLNLNWAGKA